MNKITKNSLLLIVFTLCSLHSFAQKNQSISTDPDNIVVNRDSVWGLDFDFSELDPSKVKIKQVEMKLKRLRNYNDSMLALIRNRNIKERSDSLDQLYDLLAGDSTSSYHAYSFFAGRYHSSMSGLNSALGALGWTKIQDQSSHLTNFLNFTWKKKHLINEIFVGLGISKTVSRGDLSITYAYKSPVNYNFGYCLVDKKRIQVFPYVGLLYQNSTLNFNNSSQKLFNLKNISFDSLIVATNTHTRGVEYVLNRREINLNYGLEVDFHLIYSKRKTGFIIGLRAGGGIPLITTGWVLDGERYTQFNNLNIRDYYADVVFRVYLRRHNNTSASSLQNNWWDN